MSKRPPTKTSTPSKKYTDVFQIRAALRSHIPETLRESLIVLRNQLTLHHNELLIAPQDERLLLAEKWLQSDPGATDVFSIWETATLTQNSLISAAISLLAATLTLLSTHFTYHSYGHAILKTLLSSTWTSRLNTYISGNQTETILVTLKLYNAMSDFASGKERKTVLEAFPWEIKSLPRLLTMRRKGKARDPVVDSLTKPDIRTLYVLFLLSFIKSSTSSQLKSTFLERHRDAFVAIFKGLWQDHYSVIRRVLEVCWEGLWSDSKVKRTAKVSLFGEITLSHLHKLYARVASDNEDAEHIPADVLHHFLLAICTRPGFGICFKERGWYPRETGEEDLDSTSRSQSSGGTGKIYNKILGNFLKTLQVNEDPRQQELALKILSACPELVAGYWPSANLTMEPRLSSKWIANIAFFGQVISSPVPEETFLLDSASTSTKLYNPTPPPLHSIMSNILPSSISPKLHFSKGLQNSASPLVQHCTAQALCKALMKFRDVVGALTHVQRSLEENDIDGQWAQRKREVQREMRLRVPDFQVVIAFSQVTASSNIPSSTAPKITPNPTRTALLSESAQRLQWLYHECLPGLVSEARFDVGKLLLAFGASSSSSKGKEKPSEDGDVDMEDASADSETSSESSPFDAVKQLHILRLLQESDQFSWNSKSSGGSSQTYFSILLQSYTSPVTSKGIKIALSRLLQHVLSQSILFQEDPSEVELWLMALPSNQRAPDAESPDGAKLTDERTAVILFLDDCVARCLKTPYRYMEDMVSLQASTPGGGGEAIWTGDLPSPLLMTVLEQAQAKVKNRLLSASDVLAVSTFIRRLLSNLFSKQQDLAFLSIFTERVAQAMSQNAQNEFPLITGAIRRELDILRSSFDLIPAPSLSSRQAPAPAVQDMVTQIEALPVPTVPSSRISGAFELVDYVRLVDHHLVPEDIRRVSAVILKFHPPALKDLVDALHPKDDLLWSGLQIAADWQTVGNFVTFESLLLRTSAVTALNVEHRRLLIEAWLRSASSLGRMKQTAQLVLHTIEKSQEVAPPFIDLLSSILQAASQKCSSSDYKSLKDFLFVQSNTLKNLFTLPTVNRDMLSSLHRFVRSTLNHADNGDRELILEVASHWLLQLRTVTEDSLSSMFDSVEPWLVFCPASSLLELVHDFQQPSHQRLLEESIQALSTIIDSHEDVESLLQTFQQDLIAATSILPHSSALDQLILRSIESRLPPGFDGDLTIEDGTPLQTTLNLVDARWTMMSTRTTSTVDASSAGLSHRARGSLLYSGRYKDSISKLFTTNSPTAEDLPVIHAYLDVVSSSQGTVEEGIDLPGILGQCIDMLCDRSSSPHLRRMSADCLVNAILIDPRYIETTRTKLQTRIKKLRPKHVHRDLLQFASRLHNSPSTESLRVIVTSLQDLGMRWAIEGLSDSKLDDEVLDSLVSLTETGPPCDTSTLETFLLAFVREKLVQPDLSKVATRHLAKTALKPVVVNRVLQSILQHPDFFTLTASSTPSRGHILELVHSLFHLHPANTCQVSHIEPLVGLYGGTLSTSDQMILSIFQLFETQRKTSIASLFKTWSSTGGATSSTIYDAIRSLDPVLALRTALHGPLRRSLESINRQKDVTAGGTMYDPLFLLLLFSQALEEPLPRSAPGWVELFRTNVVSVLVRLLSSKDDAMRDSALSCLSALWGNLQECDMVEKPQVLYTLAQLKNCFNSAEADQPPFRLSSYTTLVVAHALRAIFYPSNFIYPITSRFLLQRSELDATDVPLLFSMLYSGSPDDWKKERGWIIRFLTDGMAATDDFKILKRRHTWDLLASLFQSEEKDVSLRQGILELLANMTSQSHATNYLSLKTSLLSWIEAQLLLSVRDDEVIEWARIIENVIVSVDQAKIEASTNGTWRDAVCRCLLLLLTHRLGDKHKAAIANMTLATVTNRLARLSGQPVRRLTELIDAAFRRLEELVPSILLEFQSKKTQSATGSLPPHSALSIHGLPEVTALNAWGESNVQLWEASMTCSAKPLAWEQLTSRILVWRALVGERRCPAGEFARQELLRNLRTL